jgi:hypothetical protein
VLLITSLSPGQSLDNSRNIVKKDFTESLVLYYLLIKALDSINLNGRNLMEDIKASVTLSYFKKRPQLLKVPNEAKSKFSDWKAQQTPLVVVDHETS